MPDFDLKQNFPIAGVADLLASRTQKEQAMRAQQQQQLVQGLEMFGSGVDSLVQRRQRMAQAMTLSQLPEVQDMVTGGDRPVSQGPMGPVRLDQTAQGGPDVVPQQNASALSSDQMGNLFNGADPLAVMKQAFARKNELNPQTDTVVRKDASGNIVGTDSVTHSRHGKTITMGPSGSRGGGNGTSGQDKLEQQYRTLLTKNLSNRSGGLGLEDAKVNQALHLQSLIDQSYDPSTGQYSVPKNLYGELTMGLARLVSPTGTVGIEAQKELMQRTAEGDLGGALSYLGVTDDNGNLPTGSTQGVLQLLAHSIARQGETAEANRKGYIDQMHGLAPTNLDPSIVSKFDKVQMGNSYVDRPKQASQQANPDLVHLSTQQLLDLKKQMTQHKEVKK